MTPKSYNLLTSGSQVHECNKPDCWYCIYMGLKIAPELLKRKRLGRNNEWSEYETDFLIKNYKFRSKVETALKRSKASVYSKMYFIRKRSKNLYSE